MPGDVESLAAEYTIRTRDNSRVATVTLCIHPCGFRLGSMGIFFYINTRRQTECEMGDLGMDEEILQWELAGELGEGV